MPSILPATAGAPRPAAIIRSCSQRQRRFAADLHLHLAGDPRWRAGAARERRRARRLSSHRRAAPACRRGCQGCRRRRQQGADAVQRGLERSAQRRDRGLHVEHAVGFGSRPDDCSPPAPSAWWRRSACRNRDTARRARGSSIERPLRLDAQARHQAAGADSRCRHGSPRCCARRCPSRCLRPPPARSLRGPPSRAAERPQARPRPPHQDAISLLHVGRHLRGNCLAYPTEEGHAVVERRAPGSTAPHAMIAGSAG